MEKYRYLTANQEDAGKTVKTILKNRWRLSAKQISRAKFREKGITVNGKQVTVRYQLKEGDQLAVMLELAEEGSRHLIPLEGDLDVVYEDEDLIVINKPAGIVVHPSPGHYADTLANMLVAYFDRRGEHYTVRAVGRLDKDTSGLLVFAKSAPALTALERQRKEGRYHRIYLALVQGKPQPMCGSVDHPIGPVPDTYMMQQVSLQGKAARTDYQVLETFHSEDPERFFSLVQLKLYTGRTHQIRVHMSSIGHPLLGDRMYGNIEKITAGIERTALHSCRISFEHPLEDRQMEFEASLPEDMQNLICQNMEERLC